MNLKSFKLGLFGRRYIDTIYYFDEFRLSETNTPREVKKSLGGIYNRYIAEYSQPKCLLPPAVPVRHATLEAHERGRCGSKTRVHIRT